MGKKFQKNDEGFICKNCGSVVTPLNYTSRDHCPFCLASIHVDINPGDRENDCLGIMFPKSIEVKGEEYSIVYCCSKCGEIHRNKSAKDDDFNVILSVMNQTYKKNK